MTHPHKTWAEISLDNILYNYQSIQNSVSAGTDIAAVIKADAYGHGAVQIARCLEPMHVRYFIVSCIEEAMQLRRNGICTPVLILGWTPPEYASILVENNITQTVFSFEQAQQLSNALAGKHQTLLIHLKLDTGMSRLGFFFGDEKYDQLDLAYQCCRLPHLCPEGIFTHFSTADVYGDLFSQTQFQRFVTAIDLLEARGLEFPIKHCANSGAITDLPHSHLNMVRPGIVLYGLVPNRRALPMQLRPAMTLKTTVAQVRDFPPGTTVSYGRTYQFDQPRRIAVLCIGYADGLMRLLSGRFSVKIRQWTVPQVGRICMDMCMADVTDTDICAGDTAIIFGEEQTATDLAEKIGTISYEIISQISKRVPRIYFEKDIQKFSYSFFDHDIV